MAEYTINSPRATQMDEIIEELKTMNKLNGGDISALFDGTKKTYDKVMRQWFLDAGVNALTSTGITALCEKWYNLIRTGWEGHTTFATTDQSTVSTGTKGGDNADLSCTPSTDTAENTDDYAGLPLFACTNVNYTVDSTSLDIVITAIEGITDNYQHYDADSFVGVMQMSGWHYWYEDSTTYTHGYADHRVAAGHCAPMPEAVRPEDNSIRAFMVHSKYLSHTTSSKMTSCAGVTPTAFVSHNTLHTLSAATGSQYSAGTITDYAFLILMAYIKYASLTLDGIMQGCCSYNYQYYAQVAESDVYRVILPTAAASNLKVGSTVIVGTYNGSSADRGTAANYNVSGVDGFVIKAIESVTINGTTYAAVYFDTDTAITTVANGDATSGTTIVSTWHWQTGTTDSVKGNDGSPVSNTSGFYPYKLQGIEIMNGGYEIFADVILQLDGTNYTPCVVNRSANQSTSVTSNYEELTDLAIAEPASANWYYIKRMGFSDGVFSPIEVGGSSSTYTKDAFYMNATGTSGTREWRAFGSLATGSGSAGLSCLAGGRGLSVALWACLGRLSPNGNRGEWAA